jgi:hypothetical protein
MSVHIRTIVLALVQLAAFAVIALLFLIVLSRGQILHWRIL